MRSTNTQAVSWETTPGRRAVLLERGKDGASFVERALRRDGYLVDECETASEALACLNEHPVQVVVVNVPAQNDEGIALYEAQRSDPTLSGIPVVALGDPRSSRVRAHADAWLARPFSDGELLVVIERALLSRERRLLRERLAETERLALLGRIAASIGHELNNPLSLAMGNIELAKEAMRRLTAALEDLDGGKPSGSGPRARLANNVEALGACVQDGHAGLARVKRLVADLVSLGKKSRSQHRELDVTSVVRSSLSMAKGSIDERAVLECEYGATRPVLGDELRLGQLFVNLLVNAAQAIPAGQASANRINVATYQEGEAVVVDIEDTGGGMSKTHLSRIFEPFFTTKSEQGTGLGLPICQDIVEAHGGRLEVESELGRGTRIRVRLPSRPGPAG